MAHIKVFARPRSDVTPSEFFILGEKSITAQFSELSVTGATNHPITYDFQFSHVFDRSCNQEQVFNKIACDSGLLTQFIQGFNATIFAYGQTASGKSFTVEGKKNDLSNLGISQRSLSYIYESLEQRRDEHVEIQISYIEIYQEAAYDLLNPVIGKNGHSSFPRIAVREGGGGVSFFQNLSCIPAPTEKIAQQLFARAVSNRQVAETSANLISSRSHGIFTLYLTTQKVQSETKTFSKLHIVDLAGSERVSKTKARGKVLREAQSINLSLHYLEQVILALQLEQRLCGTNKTHTRKLHIPYRNSQLTMILRDSLGGNCVTAMIANLHLDTSNLGESISTCRFAQRVALVANFAKRNDQVDQKVLVKKLKSRINELEAEIKALDGKNPPLSEEDKDNCWRVSHEFIEGRLDRVFPDHLKTWNQVQESMIYIRQMHNNQIDYLTSEASNCEKCNNRQLKSMCTSFSAMETSRMSQPTSARPITTARRSSTRQSAAHSFRDQSTSYRSQQRLSIKANRSIENSFVHNSERFFSVQDVDESKLSEDFKDLESIYSKNGKRNGYLSPYDKKTIREIQKVSKAVEKSQKEKGMKKEQIKSKDAALKAQQLQLALYTLRHKAQITAEQMADQHAFVLQMKHNKKLNPSIEEEDIEQEQLAEFQLKKRLYKLEQKIEVAEQSIDTISQHQQLSQRSSLQDKNGSRTGSEPNSSGGKHEEVIRSDGRNKGQIEVTEGHNPSKPASLSSENPVSPSKVEPISSIGNVRIASKTVLKQLQIENESLSSSNKKLANQQLIQKDQEMWLKEEQTRIRLEQLKKELKKQEQSDEFVQRIHSSKKSINRDSLPTDVTKRTSSIDDKVNKILEDSGTLKRSKGAQNEGVVGGKGDSEMNVMNISSSSDSDVFDMLQGKRQSIQPEEPIGVQAMSQRDRQERSNYLESQQEMVMSRLRALQKSATLSQHTAIDSSGDASSLSATINFGQASGTIDETEKQVPPFMSDKEHFHRMSSPIVHNLDSVDESLECLN